MRSIQALAAALAIVQEPQLARMGKLSALPKGMAFLLETAAGDAEALAAAKQATGRPEAMLRKAAGFFIEQVLFAPEADSYRILGADRDTGEVQLRRHMALIMRWLHPDIIANGGFGQRLDQSAYAKRVTEAWDSLKTPARRAAYEASRARTPARKDPAGQTAFAQKAAPPGGKLPFPARNLSRRPLMIRRLTRGGLLGRLRHLLAGSR